MPRIGDRTVAPFAGGEELSCTVAPGTKIFIAAWSSECSTVEAAPYHGDDESSLRACVRAVDAGLQTPTVTLDGDPVALTEIETGLLDFTLPEGHIFDPGLPAGTTGQSVGHGWVALVHPLPPGTHTIRIENHGSIWAPARPRATPRRSRSSREVTEDDRSRLVTATGRALPRRRACAPRARRAARARRARGARPGA